MQVQWENKLITFHKKYNYTQVMHNFSFKSKLISIRNCCKLLLNICMSSITTLGLCACGLLDTLTMYVHMFTCLGNF